MPKASEKDRVKFVLVNRVVGTQPYLTEQLEMDIKDITAYLIIPENEVEHCDRMLSKPTENVIKLRELLKEHEEIDYYSSRY